MKRSAVAYLCGHYGTSHRRACQLVRLRRSVLYYRSIKDPKLALRGRMHEIARTRVRYGYRRIHILLRREGCQEALQLRSKLPRRRKMIVTRRERFEPKRANEAWSMDFVADELTNGQRFRALTVVDVFSREALAIQVGQRLRGEDVVGVCNRLVAQRRAPKRIFVDNGSEFSGRLMDLWAYHHGVRIDFSRPGKPTDNSFVESFNGSLRDECLNVHWFETLEEAKVKIEAWRQDYNESRPHQALAELAPAEFAARAMDLEQRTDLQAAEN
jgi:putative transposase